jgi:hypothetical protein
MQAIRDIMLKRDIARWLQAKMLEIEEGLVGRGAQEKVSIHSTAVYKLKKFVNNFTIAVDRFYSRLR